MLVDEAQDLSKLEWQVISKIARNTEELVLVGDDDQSIYGWKGSDARIFQKWPCKKECVRSLPKTYRLPPAIYKVVMKIQGRYNIDWVQNLNVIQQKKVVLVLLIH